MRREKIKKKTTQKTVKEKGAALNFPSMCRKIPVYQTILAGSSKRKT